MKKINFSFLVLIGLFMASLVSFAQTNAAPGVESGSINEFPTSKDALWSYAISLVAPFVVWLVTKFVPNVPKAFLPAVTPFVGIGLGLALNALAGSNLGWVDMAKAGALAVFVRETVNQMVTKRLQAEPAGS